VVQTLAALLAWIAMLALIGIAVMVSGVWRPHLRPAQDPAPQGRPQSLDEARVQAQAQRAERQARKAA
jgi:hypothetical protein